MNGTYLSCIGFCGWLLHQLLRSWNSHSQVAVGCGFSWRKRSQNPPREGVFDKFRTGTGIVFGTHECWTSIEKFERKRYVPSPIKPWVSRPLQKVARKAWFIFHKGRLRCVKIWWFSETQPRCVAPWGRYDLRLKIWTPLESFSSFRSEFCFPGLLINVGELATIIFQTTQTHVAD